MIKWWSGLVATIGFLFGIDHAPNQTDEVLASPIANESLPSDIPSGTAKDLHNFYMWMENGKLELLMTVWPNAPMDAKFATDHQYVFHLSSKASYIDERRSQNLVICHFDTEQKTNCALGKATETIKDEAHGNASDAGQPLSSVNGKMQIFAGLRNDPFFFNQTGWDNAANMLIDLREANRTIACSGGSGTSASPLTATEQSDIANALGTAGNNIPATDSYRGTNVLALLVEIDPALILESTDTVIAGWASINQLEP